MAQAVENVDQDDDTVLNFDAIVEPPADDFEVVIADEDPHTDDTPPADDTPPVDEDPPVEEDHPAEDDPPVVGEPDEPEDDEYQSFPAKIKKRVFREIRAKVKAQNELEAFRREREQAIPAIQKLVAEKQKADDQLFQMQEQYVNLLDSALEREIGSKQAELRKAKDDANSEVEVKLLSELQELVFNRQQAREAKSSFESRKQAAQNAQQPPPQQPAAQVPRANPLADRWKDKNKAWYGKEKFVAATAATQAIDAQLFKEGYNPHTTEYFAELDRRIDKDFPSLRKKQGTTTTRPTVAPAGGAAAGPAPGTKRRVTITRADMAFMRSIGLDPSNKEHLNEFARNKRA